MIEFTLCLKKDLDKQSINRLYDTLESIGYGHVITVDEEKKEMTVFSDGFTDYYLASVMVEMMIMSVIDKSCVLGIKKNCNYEGGK